MAKTTKNPVEKNTTKKPAFERVSVNEYDGDMGAAAVAAEKELRAAIKAGKTVDPVAFHARWYMAAGHKKLGRMYVKLHKEANPDLYVTKKATSEDDE